MPLGHNKTLEQRANQSINVFNALLKTGGVLHHLHVGVCIPHCFFGNIYGAWKNTESFWCCLSQHLLLLPHISVLSGNPGSFGQHWQWNQQQERCDVSPLCQGCAELWRLQLHTAAASKASPQANSRMRIQ